MAVNPLHAKIIPTLPKADKFTGPIPKLLVLDFDLTITKEHTGGFAAKSSLTPKNIEENISNLELFKSLMKTAHNSGLLIAIATFGDARMAQSPNDIAGPPLIKAYMETIFGKERKVFTPTAVQAFYPDAPNQGKNGHISLLIEAALEGKLNHSKKVKLSPKDICLFDDDPMNIKLALEKGYNAFYVAKPGNWMNPLMKALSK